MSPWLAEETVNHPQSKFTSIWQGGGVNSLPCLHSLLLSPNLHFLLQVCVLSNSCQTIFSPSARRHFWDYITFSRGTTTQAFEELGFSRALAAFISQELLLTLGDVHWSWHPLKENALKKILEGQAQFPSTEELTFHWCHWLIVFASAETRCGLMLFFPSLNSPICVFRIKWSEMHPFFPFLVLQKKHFWAGNSWWSFGSLIPFNSATFILHFLSPLPKAN